MWFVRERQTAEDITHDVFLRFLERAGTLNPVNVAIRPYLVTMCANRARDTLRRSTALSAGGTVEGCLDSRAISPLESSLVTEESQTIASCVARLPIVQREVLALHIHGDKTFREIAESSRESINTIQSRYRYAITALRRMLSQSEVP
jgi:RNA polymerase sigma-70 factor (ECF subfamily)